MTIYTAVLTDKGARIAKIHDDGISLYEYFVEYDYMGSAVWTKSGDEALLTSPEEADQIAEDLTMAE